MRNVSNLTNRKDRGIEMKKKVKLWKKRIEIAETKGYTFRDITSMSEVCVHRICKAVDGYEIPTNYTFEQVEKILKSIGV